MADDTTVKTYEDNPIVTWGTYKGRRMKEMMSDKAYVKEHFIKELFCDPDEPKEDRARATR
jgi:hypothetical protein